MAILYRPRTNRQITTRATTNRARSTRRLTLEPLEQRQVLSVAPVSADWVIDAAFDESAMVGRLDNTLSITLDEAAEGAKLDAWIDLNGDGSYGGSWERIAAGVELTPGENVLTFDIPAYARSGQTCARLLVSSEGNQAPGGPAGDSDHVVTILPPTEGGRFGSPQPFADTVDPARSAYVADFDDDGDWDIVMATDVGIRKLTNDLDEGLASISVLHGPMEANEVFVADINGDGHFDFLAAGHVPRQTLWYRSEGKALISSIIQSDPSLEIDPTHEMSVAAADIDGDGDMDVIATLYDAQQVAWFENLGTAGFAQHVVSDQATTVEHIIAADFDGDGDIDLALGQRASEEIDALTWFENDGTGVFSVHSIDGAAATAPSTDGHLRTSTLSTADLDGDGDVDLLASLQCYDDPWVGSSWTQYAWYANDGHGTFTRHELPIVLEQQGTHAVAGEMIPADLDGDGDLDLLTNPKSSGRPRYWYANDGTGVFRESYLLAGIGWAIPLDLDGDGDLDLVGTAGNDRMVWLENQAAEPESQLGETDFYSGTWISDGNARLSLVNANPGLVTVLVDLGDTAGNTIVPTLQLQNEEGEAVGTLTMDGSVWRVDYVAETTGQKLTLELGSVAGSMDLTVCNLVELVDSELKVHGGESIRYVLGQASELTVNTVVYDASNWDIDGATLIGRAVELVGTADDEIAVMSPGSATWVNPETGFEAAIAANRIDLVGGGGSDTLRIEDSTEDDVLLISEDAVSFGTGPSAHIWPAQTASGFRSVLAYSKAGGNDKVSIVLPDQRAKVSPELTKVIGQIYVRCKFFEDLKVTADRAVVWGSETADQFETVGNQMTVEYGRPNSQGFFPLQEEVITHVENLYMPIVIRDDPGWLKTAWVKANSIRAYAGGVVADTLVMHDSEGDDVLIAKPHKVIMANAPQSEAEVARGELYEVHARGFAKVTVIADQGGNNDVAKLYDSADEGVDVWEAAGVESRTWLTMRSPKRLLYEAWDFEQVGGYGFNGGLGDDHGSNVKDHAVAVDFVYEQGKWDVL